MLSPHIQPLLDKYCKAQHSGSTVGQSTTDVILAVRLFAE